MHRKIFSKIPWGGALLLLLGLTVQAKAVSVLDPSPIYYPAPSIYTNANPSGFQGIPSLEKSPEGRLWATWFTGGTQEPHVANRVVLATSADDGMNWTDVIMAIDPPDPVRTYDPVVWMDPSDRLWFFWAQDEGTFANTSTWAIVTENPEAAMPTWSEPTRLFDGLMKNKPTVLDNGNWLMTSSICFVEDGCHVVQSTDNGASFDLIGYADVPAEIRSFDEHMIIERENDLWMFIRTAEGISRSVSTDQGFTWSEVTPTNLSKTVSRFFVRELDSGNLLLVTHCPPDGSAVRSHLTAYLSLNQGLTWSGGLLLDERLGVSYPDGMQDDDGTIYISYDYNRTTDREILMSTFTEADVLAGDAVSDVARFQVMINQKGIYPAAPEPLYCEAFPNHLGYDTNSQAGADTSLAAMQTGWYAYRGDGEEATDVIAAYPLGSGISHPAINSNPLSDTEMGYLWAGEVGVGKDFFVWTDEYTLDRDAHEIDNMNWQQSFSEPQGDVTRAAVRIDGQWYVSDLSHNAINGWDIKSIDFRSTTWSTLDFTPGTTLAIGSQSGLALPDGDIGAFGIYCDQQFGSRIRFDAVSIIGCLENELPSIPGDANHDGRVDGSDVTILAGNWQRGVGAPDPGSITWEMGDFNGDGMVDGSDVTILAGNWQVGVTDTVTSVPEPNVLLMLFSVMVVTYGKRNTRKKS